MHCMFSMVSAALEAECCVILQARAEHALPGFSSVQTAFQLANHTTLYILTRQAQVIYFRSKLGQREGPGTASNNSSQQYCDLQWLVQIAMQVCSMQLDIISMMPARYRSVLQTAMGHTFWHQQHAASPWHQQCTTHIAGIWAL